MKIVRRVIEEHRLNLSSYATIISPRYFLYVEVYIHEFSSSKDKVQALVHFIMQISAGYEASIVENCKQQCEKAPPFCTTWDISIERTNSYNVAEDVSNDSAVRIHDMSVYAHFKIKRLIIYQEVLMISLDNFIGQLGGLSGLYIGWSFLSVAAFALKKLRAILKTERFKRKSANACRKQSAKLCVVCDKCNEFAHKHDADIILPTLNKRCDVLTRNV